MATTLGDPEDASIVSLLQRKKWKSAAKKILKHKELSEEVKNGIVEVIKEESLAVYQKKDFILYKSSPEDLRAFSFQKLEAELECLAPVLLTILHTVTGGSLLTTCAAASIALRGRRPQLSAFAHYINCILQYGGAKKSVFNRLSKMSLSTTHDTAMVKQRELAAACGTGVKDLKGRQERAMAAVEVEEGADELHDVFRSMEDLCLSGEKIKKQKFAHCRT